jgi:large subunit ribosomal protein L2
MGKRLIQQRRGRGTHRYVSPSHRFKGAAKHPTSFDGAVIIDILNCPGHSAPLMAIETTQGEVALTIAPLGVKVGDGLTTSEDNITQGSIAPLGDIPEGTLVYNVEAKPGDGGKFVRSSGAFARVLSKTETHVRVELPSKKKKIFASSCRAAVGVVAGGGRCEKPILKAGTAHYKNKARNRLYPRVSGVAMNSVDHPFGGSSSGHKGRPTQSRRSAPPGRKVGKIAPRRTGKKR